MARYVPSSRFVCYLVSICAKYSGTIAVMWSVLTSISVLQAPVICGLLTIRVVCRFMAVVRNGVYELWEI